MGPSDAHHLRDVRIREAAFSPSGDPAFSSWRGMRSYLDEKLARQIEYSGSSTLDAFSKYYVFGAHVCFILDRISPKWNSRIRATTFASRS